MSIEITTHTTVTIKDEALFDAFLEKFIAPSQRRYYSGGVISFYANDLEEFNFVRNFTGYNSSDGLGGNPEWSYQIRK